ncbi:MAG: hypothetical protein ACI8VC_002261 [Candidatus Endobugula sp.]|jgi:hypothetical protein
MISESLADNTANYCYLLACLARSTRRYRDRSDSHKQNPNNNVRVLFIYTTVTHYPSTTSKTTHTFLETAHLHNPLLIRLEYRLEA